MEETFKEKMERLKREKLQSKGLDIPKSKEEKFVEKIPDKKIVEIVEKPKKTVEQYEKERLESKSVIKTETVKTVEEAQKILDSFKPKTEDKPKAPRKPRKTKADKLIEALEEIKNSPEAKNLMVLQHKIDVCIEAIKETGGDSWVYGFISKYLHLPSIRGGKQALKNKLITAIKNKL
jgi:hypothetical protein